MMQVMPNFRDGKYESERFDIIKAHLVYNVDLNCLRRVMTCKERKEEDIIAIFYYAEKESCIMYEQVYIIFLV